MAWRGRLAGWSRWLRLVICPLLMSAGALSHELALLLGVKPRNMLTQLGGWARLGCFTRIGFGTYKLNTPPAETPSTNPPDP